MWFDLRTPAGPELSETLIGSCNSALIWLGQSMSCRPTSCECAVVKLELKNATVIPELGAGHCDVCGEKESLTVSTPSQWGTGAAASCCGMLWWENHVTTEETCEDISQHFRLRVEVQSKVHHVFCEPQKKSGPKHPSADPEGTFWHMTYRGRSHWWPCSSSDWPIRLLDGENIRRS